MIVRLIFTPMKRLQSGIIKNPVNLRNVIPYPSVRKRTGYFKKGTSRQGLYRDRAVWKSPPALKQQNYSVIIIPSSLLGRIFLKSGKMRETILHSSILPAEGFYDIPG
jgi:hypothetical protein